MRQVYRLGAALIPSRQRTEQDWLATGGTNLGIRRGTSPRATGDAPYTSVMRYELWHVESANLMDDFESQGEALEAARAYLTPDDDGVTVDVALMVYGDAGQEPSSLHGAELESLVFGRPRDQARQSA